MQEIDCKSVLLKYVADGKITYYEMTGGKISRI